jgi:hypothetical protein
VLEHYKHVLYGDGGDEDEASVQAKPDGKILVVAEKAACVDEVENKAPLKTEVEKKLPSRPKGTRKRKRKAGGGGSPTKKRPAKLNKNLMSNLNESGGESSGTESLEPLVELVNTKQPVGADKLLLSKDGFSVNDELKTACVHFAEHAESLIK